MVEVNITMHLKDTTSRKWSHHYHNCEAWSMNSQFWNHCIRYTAGEGGILHVHLKPGLMVWMPTKMGDVEPPGETSEENKAAEN